MPRPKAMRPGESRTQYYARRRLEREAELSRPLPAPFEHLDGHWWAGVIDDYEKATTKGEK